MDIHTLTYIAPTHTHTKTVKQAENTYIYLHIYTYTVMQERYERCRRTVQTGDRRVCQQLIHRVSAP